MVTDIFYNKTKINVYWSVTVKTLDILQFNHLNPNAKINKKKLGYLWILVRNIDIGGGARIWRDWRNRGMRLSPSSGLSRSQNKLIAKFRTNFTSAHYEDKLCYLLHLSTKRREKKTNRTKKKSYSEISNVIPMELTMKEKESQMKESKGK